MPANDRSVFPRKISLNIGTIVFGLLFIYILISILLYVTATHVRSFQVTAGPLARNAEYTGIAVYTEHVVSADASGYVDYYAGDHAKVKRGGVVYGISPVKNEASLTPVSDAATLKAIREDCEQFSQVFAPQNFHDIYSLKYMTEGEILNTRLAERHADGISSTSLSYGDATISVASHDGIVCYSTDGCENLDYKSISPSAFDEKNYSMTALKTDRRVAAGDPLYRLIESEDWSLLIPLTAKQIVKMNNLSNVRVKFLKDGVTQNADFTFYGGETVENNAWMDLYKANNIFPEILYEVDPSQANTKLSTAIMSGDYPDVFRVSGGDYKNFVQSGAVADITEAYEKYASDELKEFMNFDGGLAVKSLYVDGKLYGLPKVNDTLSNAYMMWIRQDWLDRLGLQIPTTMEELKAVAHAFTYDDPDGDGQNNTYGIAFDGMDVLTSSIGSMHPFFEGFGVYLGNNGLSYIEDENGNITWGGANAEGMKAALSMLQEMYADGAIARDFITMDSQSIFSETKAGRVGIWFGPTWGAMEPAIYATQNDKNCHIVAAVVPSATGETAKSYATAAANEIYCVSSKCAKPELLVKLWNLNVHYMNAQFCTAEEFNMYYGDSANYSGWKTTPALRPIWTLWLPVPMIPPMPPSSAACPSILCMLIR